MIKKNLILIKVRVKKRASLSYPSDKEFKIKDYLYKTDGLILLKKKERRVGEDIAIFFLTNDFVESDKFKQDLNEVPVNAKTLFVLLEDIKCLNDYPFLNNFNVIKVFDNMDLELEKQELKKFQIFISKALQIANLRNELELDIELELFAFKKFNQLDVQKFVREESYDMAFTRSLQIADDLFISWSFEKLWMRDSKNIIKSLILELDSMVLEVLKFQNVPSLCLIKTSVLGIKILDLKSFSIIENIKRESFFHGVENEKIILFERDFCRIYTIRWRKNNESVSIDDEMLCKMNKNKSHLYSNPYLLECGNSACFDCIINSYNIVTGCFKCDFASCQQEHKLPRELKSNNNFKILMAERCEIIFKEMISKGNTYIGRLDEKKGIKRD